MMANRIAITNSIMTWNEIIITYWTRPRLIFKIIMLARSIVGNA